MLLLSSADFFKKKITFSKNSFRNTIRQCQMVWIDLGPNWLQRLSADDKMVMLARKELNDKIAGHL